MKLRHAVLWRYAFVPLAVACGACVRLAVMPWAGSDLPLFITFYLVVIMTGLVIGVIGMMTVLGYVYGANECFRFTGNVGMAPQTGAVRELLHRPEALVQACRQSVFTCSSRKVRQAASGSTFCFTLSA